jgi:hypothetical protein
LNPHLVVRFVTLLQTTQDRDGVRDGRLSDLDRLEPALERRVLFDVLSVLVDRRRADAAQLAARQRGLQEVGRVHGAFRRSRADERVQLVDEQDDPSLGFLDLFQDRLQSVFELAAVLRARDHRPEIEGDDAPVPERFRDVAIGDAPCDSLDDRGLSDAGIADQHGVVLGAAPEDLDRAADLLVPADDRVELPASREIGQVGRISPEGLELVLGVLVGNASGAADLTQGMEDVVGGGAELPEDVRRFAFSSNHRQKKVLGRHVIVLKFLCSLLGKREDVRERARDSDVRLAGDLGKRSEAAFRGGPDSARIGPELREDGHDDSVGVLAEGRQQMERANLRMAEAFRQLL